MNKDTDNDKVPLSSNGKMNIWVGDQIDLLSKVIDHSRGVQSNTHEAYLRGVLAGIRILQNEWLMDKFK